MTAMESTTPPSPPYSDAELERLLQTLLNAPPPEERLRAAIAIRRYSEVATHRRAMTLLPAFIDALSHVLCFAGDSETGRRCQYHCLLTLTHLTLEDPKVDQHLAYEENMLPGLVRVLDSGCDNLQEQGSILLDYLSVTKDNRTLICNTDALLEVVLTLVDTTLSGVARGHLLQALAYLSTHNKNLFIMAREKSGDIFTVMANQLQFTDDGTCTLALQVVQNLCRLRENVPQVAKHHVLRQRMKTVRHDGETRAAERAGTILQIIADYEATLAARSQPQPPPPQSPSRTTPTSSHPTSPARAPGVSSPVHNGHMPLSSDGFLDGRGEVYPTLVGHGGGTPAYPLSPYTDPLSGGVARPSEALSLTPSPLRPSLHFGTPTSHHHPPTVPPPHQPLDGRHDMPLVIPDHAVDTGGSPRAGVLLFYGRQSQHHEIDDEDSLDTASVGSRDA